MSIKRLGPYLVQDILGRGGMGTVFRAKDENHDDHEVAVKVLSAAYADDDHFRSRFESEIQTLLQLDHPNIVRILGHGEEDGNLFFAMELVKGQSLHELQKSGHRFTWQEVIGIAMDVCSGLQHAHYRGIIHRDIKPANLLKTEAGTTKITDFGIAKLFGGQQLTAHGGAIGTADYMSPEQARGTLVTERSDLFSLGCVMYSLLGGRPPFAEKNIQATIQSLATKAPTPLRQLAPEVPTEFEDLIHRLLEKDPANRFKTAQAVNRRLVDMLELIKAEAEAQTALSMELDDSGEYELSPQDMTIGSVEMTQKIGEDTLAEAAQKSQPADKTLAEGQREDFYQVVERKRKTSADEYEARTEGPVWPFLVALVVVLGLIAWGISATLFSQPDADQLFAQITATDSPDQQACEDFLERFPEDPRHERVEAILTEIESRKLERQLLLRKQLRGVKSLFPIEILLLDAVEERKNNPVIAVEKLDHLIRIYEGDEELSTEESEALSSAFFYRTRITDEANVFVEKHEHDLQRALQRAQAAVAEGNPERARSIHIGIIESFQDQTWAAPWVEQARAALAK